MSIGQVNYVNNLNYVNDVNNINNANIVNKVRVTGHLTFELEAQNKKFSSQRPNNRQTQTLMAPDGLAWDFEHIFLCVCYLLLSQIR